MLELCSPTIMRLSGYQDRLAQIKDDLTYTDKQVEWALRGHVKNERWFVKYNGQAAYASKLAELQEAKKRCLLFQDEHGLYTYTGMRPYFQQTFGDEARTYYELPTPKLIPWENKPEDEPRYYQLAAEKELLANAPFGPCGVEMGTGLGKSYIIEMLLKALGLPAVVMSPSVNIAKQIHRDLLQHFGSKRVGFFGDGKKQLGKLFTVGVAASLRNVEIGTPAWEQFSKASIFIADESHMCPAETLQQVCFGLLANAPYRFFFSGTQMRADGKDLLLDAITGPIVYTMTVKEGVDQGFLAMPQFRMIWCDSNVRERGDLYHSDDANDMTRAHVIYNPEIIAKAAEVANKSVSLMGRPTVIMVEEYEQLQQLIPHLRYDFRFAHGSLTKEAKKFVPEKFWKDDPTDLVDRFNAGEFPILIGTSCVITGTNFKRVKMIVNLRGGKSEVELRQITGRGTRRVPGKEDCVYVDFGIRNVPMLEKHAKERVKIYREIYPNYQEIFQ
jgi:superfamily II DNA or RNA helicase